MTIKATTTIPETNPNLSPTPLVDKAHSELPSSASFAQVIYASSHSITNSNGGDQEEEEDEDEYKYEKKLKHNDRMRLNKNQEEDDKDDEDHMEKKIDNREGHLEVIELDQENGDELIDGNGGDDAENVDEEAEVPLRAALKKHGKKEAIEMLKITWPIIIGNVCGALLGAVDVAFVGHLGDKYLAAAGLANAYFSCVGFIPVGLLAAQDTMISQAEGMKNDHVKRIILGRSFLIMTLVALPVAMLFWFSKQVLVLLGQNPEIAALSGVFNRYLIIGLYPYIVTNILSRYLTAQGRVIFPMVCNIFANGINVLLNTLLIQGIGYKGLGYVGAPIATSLTRTCVCIFTIMYTLYVERKDAIQRAKEQSEISTNEVKPPLLTRIKNDFRMVVAWPGVAEYLKLAIPGMVMLMLEIIGFELTTLFSGYLPGAKYTAAHAITLNTIVLTFMIPLSISIACSIRVGVCLGAKLANQAKVVVLVTYVSGVSYMTLNGFILFLLRRQIGKLFTNEVEVLDLVSTVLPVCALFQIFDGAQVCLAGALRGMGRQIMGAFTNIIGFYVIGLPLGAFLAFYFKLHLVGLWTGLAAGLVTVSFILALYIGFFVNFTKEVERAHIRIQKSDVQLPSSPNEAGIEEQQSP